MSDQRARSIAERAHAIWEAEGRPDGREEAHWHQAERELAAQEAGSAPPAKPASRKRKQPG